MSNINVYNAIVIKAYINERNITMYRMVYYMDGSVYDVMESESLENLLNHFSKKSYIEYIEDILTGE